MGSTAKIECLIMMCGDLDSITDEILVEVTEELAMIRRTLNRLIKRVSDNRR